MEVFKIKEAGCSVPVGRQHGVQRRIGSRPRESWQAVKRLCKACSTISGWVALGLSAALAAGPAVAAISWSSGGGSTLFEDDGIDFILDSDLNPKAGGMIEEGDVLVSVFEFNVANGASILPDELTGVAALQVDSLIALGIGTLATITFEPYAGGLDAILALGSTDEAVVGGGAGGGAMVASWLDPEPDLDISADNVTKGTVSCNSLEECINQSVDGDPWQVDGFAADPEEFWTAPVAQLDTSIVVATDAAMEVGFANAGLSILDNQTGAELATNSLSCFPFCGAGRDGFVDVIGGGSMKGGLGLSTGLVADGGFATGDLDLHTSDFGLPEILVAVPEPSTLALLTAGFLGMGAARRRRRKVGGV